MLRKRNISIALSTFTVLILGLAVANSASAEVLATLELNNGQFRVDYLGINPSYEKEPNAPVRTVTYAVTNRGCSAQTANLAPSFPTTGNGKGKGGGPKEPKVPKCAGMSHFSVGFETKHSLQESDLIDPSDTSGDCVPDPNGNPCYTTTLLHSMCGTVYVQGVSYHCLEGTFSPTYGWSGATKFAGLKFSKSKEEDSLPVGRTFIFHITYQRSGRYEEGCVDVLIKPGNGHYWGPLLGPILKDPEPQPDELPCAPNPKPN